ncbi:unnamed protein product [Rhizophagus irregularis]|nr:unnamed protein product [Rhizophagus irregularis]CAB5361849.1 unnamed protein product [Rhizophagus irregularis]
MEEESSEDTQTSEFTHDDCNNIACENFIIMWAKQQGFQIIKDHVVHLEETLLQKKIGCPFVINASCPKLKNLEEYVIINKIVEQHNHPLDVSIVEFEDSRKFTDSMIEDTNL